MSREDICARIKAICDSVASSAGIKRVFRNYPIGETGIPDELLPAIVVIDGNEENTAITIGNKRPASAPQIMMLHVEILIALGAPHTAVGSQLNSASSAIISALRSDSTLVALTFEGEGPRYMGMEMGLVQAQDTLGMQKLNFDIRYKL